MLGQNNKGDTLIEVLFSVAVFSLLAVGAIAIMNRSMSAAERALEITLVRNEIDSQADAIRFLNASYIASYNIEGQYSDESPAKQWKDMRDYIISINNTTVSALNSNDTSCPSAPAGSFIINAKRAIFIPYNTEILKPAESFSQISYDENSQVLSSNGLWIEAIKSPTTGNPYQSNAGYIDFYIKSCWYSTGQDMPVTIGTIVRLYEPI